MVKKGNLCGRCASIIRSKNHVFDKKCQCISCKAKRGEFRGRGNGRYKDGRKPLRRSIRGLKQQKIWRIKVFQRDKYTCQDCGQIGRKLHPHHKKYFSVILDEFLRKYSQFNPIRDKETLLLLATKYKPFWDVSNGITLCKKCHNKYPRFIGKK